MKKLFAILMTFVLALSLIACSSTNDDETSEKSKDNVQVGIVLPTRDEPRYQQYEEQFKELFAGTDISYSVLYSQGSPATELSNVEALISQGMKVLIYAPNDAEAAGAIADTAKEAGVSIIGFERLAAKTKSIDYYVTFDPVEVGRAIGGYLADNNYGKGTPLYIYSGASSDSGCFPNFEGMWEKLQPKIADGTFIIANCSAAEKVKDEKSLSHEQIAAIFDQITTEWDYDVAKSLAEANLTSNDKELKGDVCILAPNDGTGRAIADVFATDPDITAYQITGQDAEKASVQYLIDGKQSMTLLKDARLLSAGAVDIATKLLNGEKPETNMTYSNGTIDIPTVGYPLTVVTKDNVKTALIDSGLYKESDFTGLK